MASTTRFAVMVMMLVLMLMFLLVQMSCMVIVRAAMMSAVRVVVQNTQDDEVTDKSENACYEHIDRLLDFVFPDHSMGGLDEKFDSDDVDEGYIEERPKGLSLDPAEGEIGGTDLFAEQNCNQRNDIGQYIRKEMECVWPDCDGVS